MTTPTLQTGLALLVIAIFAPTHAQVGPDYEVPSSIVTGRYAGGTLRAVRPLDGIPRGSWWTIFRDKELDRLQAEAVRNSETLKGAVARFDQARAEIGLARANQLPTVSAGTETNYVVTSENQASAFPLEGFRYEGGSYRTPLDFNWEIDLWGKIRRENEAALAEATASGNAMQSALLSLHAEVAMTYFQLRALDSEIAAVHEAIELRREAVRIATAQVRAGTTTDLPQVQAETELELARSEAAALADQRSQLFTALAILTGTQPAAFSIQNHGTHAHLPTIPAGVPSDLLERRPDIAAAERRLAAATARVGVAEAAAYPSVQLTGLTGFDSGDVELLLEPLSFFATIGPRVTIPIFSGGRNRANKDRANASHAEILADYRQTILVSFGEVEDSLATVRLTHDQIAHLGRAMNSAERASDLARAGYEAGSGLYLEVIQADRSALEIERSIARLRGQRLIATVELIKALGGGWNQNLPSVIPAVVEDPAAIMDQRNEIGDELPDPNEKSGLFGRIFGKKK